MPFDASFFDAGPDRSGTASVKWSQPGFCPEGHIPLWVADMDFACAPAITEALVNRAGHPSHGYTYTGDEDRQAFCAWWQRRHGVSLKTSDIGLLPSVVSGLRVGVEEFTKPGEGVIIQPPVYGPFYASIEDAGRKVLEAPLRRSAEGYYTMDLDALETKIVENKVKLFLLCSPHNPVGRVWSEEELRRVGEICLRHGVIVVSDEIHSDFTREGHPHTVFAKLGTEFEQNCLICTAPSKTFNLAGLQISNIFVPNPELRKKLLKEIAAAGYGQVGLMGLVACQAAYEEGAEWLAQLKAYLEENRKFVKAYLEEHLPEIRLIEPEGTYLLWLDFKALHLNEKELEHLIVDKAHLWLDSGAMFGPDGEGFERINIACPRVTVEKALKQLEAAIRG